MNAVAGLVLIALGLVLAFYCGEWFMRGRALRVIFAVIIGVACWYIGLSLLGVW